MVKKNNKVTKKMLWISIIGIAIMMIAISVNSETKTIKEFGDGNQEKIIVFPEGGGLNDSANFSIENGANITSASMDISGGLPNGTVYPYNLSFNITDEILWKFDGVGYGAMGYQTVFWDNESDFIIEFNDTEVPTTKWAGDIKLPKSDIESAFLYVSNILPQKFEDGKRIDSTATNDMTSVALGDMDNDGDLDLVGGSKDGNIYIFNNTERNGDFTLELTIHVDGDGINSIALGDLDIDGDLDIGCADDDNFLYYILLDGHSYNIGQIDTSNFDDPLLSIDFGYLDNDGYLDIASASQDSDFYYAINNGDGTFDNDATQINTGAGVGPMISVDIGDVDNDGDQDIVGGNGDGNFYLARNNNLVFTPTTITGGPENSDMKSVTLADVNFNSYIDLLGANEDGDFYLSLNNGDGTYPAASSITGSSSSMNSVITDDLDLDGDLDIIGANNDNNVYISKNNGDGTFSTVPLDITGGENSLLGITVGDINIDGDVDIITCSVNFDFYVYLNDYSSKYNLILNLDDNEIWNRQVPNQPFLDSIEITGVLGNMHDVAFGDVDNDGWIDIVGSHEDRNFYLCRNNGDGTFGNVEQISTQAIEGAMLCVALGDVDDDGWIDIVGGNLNGDFYISLNDGSGDFPPGTQRVDATDGTSMFSITLADINNDGDLDIIGGNDDGNIYIANNTGSGTFDNVDNISTYSNAIRGITIGDLNNDGQIDLIDSNNDGNFTISLNYGDWFEKPFNISINDNQMWDVYVDDVDNNGFFDILGANDDGKFYIAVNNNFTFNEIVEVETDATILSSACFIDMDNDGDLDIFGASQDNDFYVSKNIGNKNFEKAKRITGGTNGMFSIASGDVDNDGNIDIIGANRDGNFYLTRNDWGNFQETTNNFTTKLQDYIKTATPKIDIWENEICTIPFNITSDYPGSVILENINITYNYTITLSNFSSTLNNYTKIHDPDQGDNITIPLNFTSQTTGKLWLGNVNIEYIPAPDLIIETLKFSDDCTYDGKNTTIEVTIKNKGENEASKIDVLVYLDNTTNLLKNYNISKLVSGTSNTTNIIWSASGTLGDHKIIVVVDSDNTIKEVNENNNNKTLKTIDWKIVDDLNYINKIINLTGNLIVENSGKLLFSNTTLKMNCSPDGEYYIEVKNGGQFYITDSDNNASVITSFNDNFEFLFFVRNGGKLTMKNSELHNCGYDDLHKGLTIESDEVTLEYNQISDNYIGIFLNNSNAEISQNDITNNLNDGIFLQNSQANIHNNTITDNINGIYCQDDKSIISDNEILRNTNGIYSNNSKSEIKGNRIFDNTNHGIHSINSPSLIWYNIINNSAVDEIHLDNSAPKIDFCEIRDTTGNGIYCEQSSPIVSNSTINVPDQPLGNDFDLRDNSHPRALNTTFSEDNVNFEDGESNLSVEWFLNVRVVHGDNSPIKGANVVVKDNNSVEIKNTTTKDNGWIKWIECIEYVENQTNVQAFTPHNITAKYNGETLYSNVTMNENKEVILNLTEIELIIKSLRIKDNYMRDGAPTPIEAIIQNTGNKNVSNIDISFYYDVIDLEHLIQNITIAEELGHNDEKFVSVPWDATGMLGDYKIILRVDPEKLINETNEDNNTKEIDTEDWKIVGDIKYTKSAELDNIIISGNITIVDELTIDGITLWINYKENTRYSIIVDEGGYLNVINDAKIDAYRHAIGRYKFKVFGEMNIINSTINWTWSEGDIGGIQIFSDDVFINNSTISNSYIGIYCEGSSPMIGNSTFESINDYKFSLGNSAEPIIINTIYSKDDVKFIDEQSKLLEGWFIDVETIDNESSNTVPNAEIVIKDSFNNTIYEGITDEDGLIKWILCIQHHLNPEGKYISHNYHNISAIKNNLEGYKNIDIESNMIEVDKIEIFMYEGNIPPVAKLKPNKPIALPTEDIEFLGDESYDPDGNKSNMKYMFEFDNGYSTGWISEPNYVYNYEIINLEKHEYIVTLHVKDEKGKQNSDEITIKLNNPPNAIAKVKKNVKVNEEVTFDASDSFDEDEIDKDNLTYHWDFGDGYKDDGIKIIHSYSAEGDYTVILTVNDSVEERTDKIVIKVKKNIEPIANLTHELGPGNIVSLEGEKVGVTFYATESSDPDGNYDDLEFNFDFGDGYSTGWFDVDVVEHFYKEIGDYTVVLYVRDEIDESSSSIMIHVVTYGVELSANPQEDEVQSGGVANFIIEIKNTGMGNQKDKFNISIEKDDTKNAYLINETYKEAEWLIIEIYSAQSKNITLNASIPANTSPGKYSIKIKAISINDATVSHTITISVNVKADGGETYEIEVSSTEMQKTVDAGKTTTITFNVENTGNSDVNVMLKVKEKPDGWEVKFSTNSFELKPEESKDVTITISIPEDAEAKTYNIRIEIIYGDASNQKTEERTFTIIVNKTSNGKDGEKKDDEFPIYAVAVPIVIIVVVIGFIALKKKGKYEEDEEETGTKKKALKKEKAKKEGKKKPLKKEKAEKKEPPKNEIAEKKEKAKDEKKKKGETLIKCPKCDKQIEVPAARPITIRCPECDKESTLKE